MVNHYFCCTFLNNQDKCNETRIFKYISLRLSLIEIGVTSERKTYVSIGNCSAPLWILDSRPIRCF